MVVFKYMCELGIVERRLEIYLFYFLSGIWSILVIYFCIILEVDIKMYILVNSVCVIDF